MPRKGPLWCSVFFDPLTSSTVTGRTHFLHQPPKTLGCSAFLALKKKRTVWLLLVLFMPLFNLSTWSVISPHNVSLFTPVFHQQINVSFTTQRYIIHLSWPDTSLMFLLSLVVCIGLFVVRMGTLAVYRPRPDPQRAQGTSCVVSFTVKGNSASAAFQLKTMSCWMWCCGIWTENSRHSD